MGSSRDLAEKERLIAKTPNLALRASFPTIVGDVPFKGTPPLPIRARDLCPAFHTASFKASAGDVPFKGTPPQPIRA